MSHRHPETGRVYREVFPFPTDIYTDWRASYERLSAGMPWLSAHGEPELPGLLDRASPEEVLVLWHDLLPETRPPTRAKLVLYWPETVGPGAGLIPHQASMLRSLIRGRHALYDGILLYDAWSRNRLGERLGRDLGYRPAGYDPEVMGRPDWSIQKTHDLAVYGSGHGIRLTLMPEMRERYGGRMDEFSGVHGKERAARLSRSRISLYVPHSAGSFPQWRLWHAVASTAALAGPWVDAWPAEIGRECLAMPFPDPTAPENWFGAIDRALETPDLEAIARRAHERLSGLTVQKAFEDWTVPEIERMLR